MEIDAKLDKIQEDISSIKIHLGEYNVSLKDHIRRTELLEESIDPIKKHVAIVNFIGKIALAILASEIGWEIIKKMLE